MYHRFGEDRYPSTNVSEEQFKSHIEYILNNELKVIDLNDVIKSFDMNETFDDKAVAFLLTMHIARFIKLLGQCSGIKIFLLHYLFRQI